MSIIDSSSLDVIEGLPGWEGCYFHAPSMTFAHYDSSCGASIHERSHPQEHQRGITIDGRAEILRPGLVAIVPSNLHHPVKALTIACAIIVDYRVRITDANRRITPRNEGKERDVR